MNRTLLESSLRIEIHTNKSELRQTHINYSLVSIDEQKSFKP